MHFFFAVLLVLLLGACSSSGPIHEPTPLEPLESEAPVKRVWSLSLPSSSEDEIYDTLQTALFEGVLYTVSASGVVQAHEVDKAKRLWKQSLDVVVSAGLGVSSDLLLLGTSKGEVLALSRTNGKLLWRVQASSEVMAVPVMSHNLVIVRCGDGVTQALSAENGEEVWRYSSTLPALSLRGEALPVITDDLVLLGQSNGRIAALSIFDGVVQWEATVVAPKGRTDLERMVDVDAAPVVVGEVIYVVAHQGRVMALSRLTGTMLWSRDLGASVGLAIDEQNLYLVDDAGQVWALERRTGSTLWKSEKLKYRDVTAPVVYQNSVVVADFEGYLHWLSKTDGQIIARYQQDDEGVRVAPLVSNTVLYSRSKTGQLEALKFKR